MSAKAFAATLGVLAVVGLLGFGLASKGGADIAEGEPAPEVELPPLEGEGDGSLADYRGKWVLVNFWASWCEPCRTESPDLQRYQQEHEKDGFTVLGVNQEDLSDDAKAFVEEFDLSYPQLRDAEGDLADPWGMTGLPENFLIDPEGRIAHIRRGPVDQKYLDDYVTPLITGEGRLRLVTALTREPSGICVAMRRVSRTVRVLLLAAALAACLAFASAPPAGAQENDSSPGIAAPAPRGSAEPQTDLADLEDEVMCPICGTALGLSQSPQADREREFIRQLISEGKTEEEIKDALVAEYGPEVLAVPEREGFDLAAWLVPGGAILLAAVAIFIGLRRWRRRPGPDDPDERAPPRAGDEERLEADLARYEL